MPNQLIEERLQRERNGWRTEFGFRVPNDWDWDTINALAEEYNAKISVGPVVRGHHVIFLLISVTRPDTLLDKVYDMLRKNRELQDKAWAEYEKQKCESQD